MCSIAKTFRCIFVFIEVKKKTLHATQTRVRSIESLTRSFYRNSPSNMLEHFVPKTTQKLKRIFLGEFFFDLKYLCTHNPPIFSAAVLTSFFFSSVSMTRRRIIAYCFSMMFKWYNGSIRDSKLNPTGRPFNPIEMSVSHSFDVSNVHLFSTAK